MTLTMHVVSFSESIQSKGNLFTDLDLKSNKIPDKRIVL
jgi:hypothetical protein